MILHESPDAFRDAVEDDYANETMAGDWKEHPLSSSPLLTDLESTWTKVAPGYRSNLQGLVWDENLPEQDEILITLQRIKKFISSFDKNQKSPWKPDWHKIS